MRSGPIVVAGLVVAVFDIIGGLALRPLGAQRSAPPPPGGYFGLRPVDSYAQLPDDAAAAAAQIQRSTWEALPGNATYNDVMPVHLTLQR